MASRDSYILFYFKPKEQYKATDHHILQHSSRNIGILCYLTMILFQNRTLENYWLSGIKWIAVNKS